MPHSHSILSVKSVEGLNVFNMFKEVIKLLNRLRFNIDIMENPE